ncbi:MAG TPA: response regulator [Terriglobales bacterium]|nr:response regulator [Terriglobales bacterium]
MTRSAKDATGRATKPIRPSILVVDDEERIADTLVLILKTKQYEAEAAYDAASALEICSRRTPDLVISDVVMPGMNGIEMAVMIRSHFPSCRILLFSGQAATADLLEEARHRGHEFELLAKPVHPETLLAKVNQLIHEPHSVVRPATRV